MKWIRYCSIIFILCVPIEGVGNAVDSLKQQLEQIQKEDNLPQYYFTSIALGDALMKVYRHQEALDYYEQCVSIEGDFIADSQHFRLYSQLGYCHYWLDAYPLALDYLKGARKWDAQASLALRLENLSRLADVYINLGNYKQALEFQFKVLDMAEQANDSIGIAKAYRVIGRIHWYNQQFDQSLESAQRALQYFPKDDIASVYTSLAAIASIYTQLEEQELAEKYSLEALALAKRESYGYGIAFSTGMLGEIYKNKGEDEKAEAKMRTAITLFEELGIKYEASQFGTLLAGLYMRQGKVLQAIEILDQAKSTAEAIASLDLQKDVLAELAASHAALNRYDKAYAYQKQYESIKDSLNNQEQKRALNRQQMQYEIQKRERKIELLKQRNEIERSELLMYGIGIGLALLLLILWLVFARYRSQAKNSKILTHKNLEILSQNEQLQQANQDLQLFAGIVSKDLEAPMLGIKHELAKLGETQEDSEYSPILRHTLRLEEVLHGLAMYSVISNEKMAYEMTPASKLIEEAIASLEEPYRPKGIRIDLHNLPELVVDRRKMVQVFKHLITYLVHYLAQKDLGIRISTFEQESEYVFCLKSRGTEIPEEKLPSLFQLFNREYQDLTDQTLSMGLAVSRKIIEQHRGRLWVETHTQQGSSFYFTVPFSYL